MLDLFDEAQTKRMEIVIVKALNEEKKRHNLVTLAEGWLEALDWLIQKFDSETEEEEQQKENNDDSIRSKKDMGG